MLYLSLFFISTLFCTGFAVNDVMRAVFDSANSEVVGNVTVQDSIINLLLDISTILSSGNLPAGCDSSKGFLYHVHTQWTHSSITSAYGSNCNSTFVGLHYDPYGACSNKSANSACYDNGGCIDGNYACKNNYDDNVYSCEVGDWSGKYGTLFNNDGNLTANVQSFGEITGNQLTDKSIVFHCANNLKPAFCAKFNPIPGTVFVNSQKQSNGFSLKADFSSALRINSNKKAFITMDYTGQVTMRFDKAVFQNLITPCSSNLYKIWLGNAWKSANLAEISCNSDVYGTFYDPTNQCYAGTSATDSPYCSDGELCTDSGYTYQCNYNTDPFSCSPSDLSGRYTTIDANLVNSNGVSRAFSDRYMGDLSELPHKSVVLLCSADNLPVACAKLQNVGIGTAAATFTQKAQGFVRVKDGEVTVSVSLNRTKVLYGDLLPANCFDNGVSIHIHEKWTYSDTADRVGPVACNATFTGGHWDPWAACGPSTGNKAVCKLSPSPSPACVQKTYKCNSTNYMNDPFACEVGDWSGKYGVYKVSQTDYQVSRTNSSYMEVDASALVGRSVVIHCTSSGGTRAVCAPFDLQQGLHDGEDTEPDHSLKDESGNLIYNATVELNDSAGYIELINTGAFYVDFDLSSDTECSATINYGVFNDDECANLYDPTIQCPPKSEYTDTLCVDGKTCNATSEYKCLFIDDQYTCSPSDLSGRYGQIENKKVANSGYDDLMIPLKALRTKYFGLFCNDTLAVIYCSPWNVAVKATAHPTKNPTRGPTDQPTPPTKYPTKSPTKRPTTRPTTRPTKHPTLQPTDHPTLTPTSPTLDPTKEPSFQPTHRPSTHTPTSNPTKAPTNTVVLNTTEPVPTTTDINGTNAAKSVNRITIGAGLWLAFLGLFWI